MAYVKVRPFLAGMNIPNEQIGWNNNRVTMFGAPIEADTQLIEGEAYADEDQLNTFLGRTRKPAAAAPSAPMVNYSNPYAGQMNDILSQIRSNIAQPLPTADQIKQGPEYANFLRQQQEATEQGFQDVRARLAAGGDTANLQSTPAAKQFGDIQRRAADDQANMVLALLKQEEVRQQTGVNNLFQYLNQLRGLDSEAYRQKMDQFRAVEPYLYETIGQQIQRQEMEERAGRQRIEDAWNRVKNVGYVDNESSVALGLPVGMLSGEARKTAEEREFRKELEQLQQQNVLAQITARKQADIDVMNERDKNKPLDDQLRENLIKKIAEVGFSGLTSQEKDTAKALGLKGTETNNEATIAAMSLLINAPSREEALVALDRERTALQLQGVDTDLLDAEIDRVFPPPVAKPPFKNFWSDLPKGYPVGIR